MKRRFFSVFGFTLFAGLFVLLSSCSGFMRETGSATFSISPEVLKAAIDNASKESLKQNKYFLSNAARLNSARYEDDAEDTKEYPEYEDYIDSEKIELKVSLLGKYQQTITKLYTMQELESLYATEESKGSSIDITFDNIPVGTDVYAEATLTFIYNHLDKEQKEIAYKGTSDTIRIVSGPNRLTLALKALKESHQFRLKIYVEDDTVTETDVEGYKYVYYIDGTFDNYKNFEEDFYEFILSQQQSLNLTDYEYNGSYDISYDENGVIIYRVYFEKKAVKPVDPVEIDYVIHTYRQKENTTYDETKTPDLQEDIFVFDFIASKGAVSEDKWESELKNDIIPRVSKDSGDNYTYCGYALKEDGENAYIIKIYFKAVEKQVVDEDATVKVSVSMAVEKEVVQEEQEKEEIKEEQESDKEPVYKETKYTLKVTLTGSDDYYKVMAKEITETELLYGSADVTFTGVPVGEVVAKAVLYCYFEEVDETSYSVVRQPFAKAEYETEVSAGDNVIQLAAKTYEQEITSYVINYYFEDGDAVTSEYPGYALNETYTKEGQCTGWQDLYVKLAESIKIKADGYTYNSDRIAYIVETDGSCTYVLFYNKVTDPVIEEPEPKPVEKEAVINVAYAYEAAGSKEYEVDSSKVKTIKVSYMSNEDPTELIQEEITKQTSTLKDFGLKTGFNYSKAELKDSVYTIYYDRAVTVYTFNAGEGKFADDKSTCSINGKYGASIDLSNVSEPEYDGYSLTGWTAAYYATKETTEPVTEELLELPATFGIYYKVEFTAEWAAVETTVSYTIKYLGQNLAGTAYTESLCDNVTGNGVAGNSITPASKTFDGFTIEKAIEPVVLSADGNNVIEIKYNRKTITYTFHSNNGNWLDSGTSSYVWEKTASGLYGQTVSSIANPSRNNFQFLGWARTSSATQAEYASGANIEFTVDSDTPDETSYDLYAVWTRSAYHILFQPGEAEDGNNPISYDKRPGESVTGPRYNYAYHTFIGWEYTINGETKSTNGISYTVENSDVTLVAKWQENGKTPNVVFSTAPSGTEEVEVDYGAQITLSCSGNGSGNAYIYYTIDGTDPSESETVIAYDSSTPIAITEDTTIKAYAVNKTDNLYDSDVTSVSYKVIQNGSISGVSATFELWEDGSATDNEIMLTLTVDKENDRYTITVSGNKEYESCMWYINGELVKAGGKAVMDTILTQSYAEYGTDVYKIYCVATTEAGDSDDVTYKLIKGSDW